MNTLSNSNGSRAAAWVCGVAALVLSLPAAAEKADRTKPMSLESDQPCTVNLLKQTSSCSGNVVVAQGTLLIRADRVELRETSEGYKLASAIGTDAKPAQYRQKRDNVDEHVEGTAHRIDYDSRANTLRFEGQAVARTLRGATTANEVHGNVLIWDNNAELFNVQGGAATAANPGGRVRLVITPPPNAASAPNAAASAAATAPLRSTPALGERK